MRLLKSMRNKGRKSEIKSCQYCGGEDFRYGYPSGDSRLGGAPGFLEDQEPIHYLVCAECGAIIFSWVTNPRKYSKKVLEKSV